MRCYWGLLKNEFLESSRCMHMFLFRILMISSYERKSKIQFLLSMVVDSKYISSGGYVFQYHDSLSVMFLSFVNLPVLKQWYDVRSLSQEDTLCCINRTMSARAKARRQAPQVNVSAGTPGVGDPPPSAALSASAG